MRMLAVAGISFVFVAILASPIATQGPIGAGMESAVTGLKHMLGK